MLEKIRNQRGAVCRETPFVRDEGDPPLPRILLDFVATCNGVMLADGYVRLFGYGGEPESDARSWNDVSNWKWAWPEQRPIPYWVIGCTAFGDLFVISLVDLHRSPDNAPVLCLDYGGMRSTFEVGKNTAAFLEGFLVRCTESVPLLGIDRIRRVHGPLNWNELLLWDPPCFVLADDGEQHDWPEGVRVFHPFDVMVLNADLFKQACKLDSFDGYSGLEVKRDTTDKLRGTMLFAGQTPSEHQ
jgi:hypothetical protein